MNDERLQLITIDRQRRAPRRRWRFTRLTALLGFALLAVAPLFLTLGRQQRSAGAQVATVDHLPLHAESAVVASGPENLGQMALHDDPSATAGSASRPTGDTAPAVHPPYAGHRHCRRTYDRAGRTDRFTRCGTAERWSCCRSGPTAGDSACYYTVDATHCAPSSDATAAAREQQWAAEPAAASQRRATAALEEEALAQPSEAQRTRAAGGASPDLESRRIAGGEGEDAPQATSASSRPEGDGEAKDGEAKDGEAGAAGLPAVPALTQTATDAGTDADADADAPQGEAQEELRGIIPMTLRPRRGAGTDGRRRASRLVPPPAFNLSWTRRGSPPHSDGWEPSAALRARLPERDIKELYYDTCAVVGSGGRLRRSGYGRFIDAHALVIRFNGAPAGGTYAADVGSRTGLSVLADVVTSDCVKNRARQVVGPSRASWLEGAQLTEGAPGSREIKGCAYYPDQSPQPPILFLPRRGGAQQVLEYAAAHTGAPVYVKSDAFGAAVDATIDEYARDHSHPTSGFNGVNLALHICGSVDVYGFGSPREKYYSSARGEKAGSQHLYRTEMRWLLGLELRFPGRVRVWP